MKSPVRIVAVAAVLVSLVSSVAFAENRTTIQIVTVLASKEGHTMDPRLVDYRTELRALRFRSYTLVNSETRVLHGSGGQSGMELPGGRYLHLTTEEHTPDHVRLHILLNEDNRPVVNTSVKLELGSVVLLGGPRDQAGTLVIRIGSRPWRSGDDEADDEQPIPQNGARPGPDSGAADPAGVPGVHEIPSSLPLPPTPAMPVGAPAASSSAH